MSGTEPDVFRDALVRSLQAAPGQRLSGADLGNRLRAHTGRTVKELGYPNLAEFVRVQLAGQVSMVQSSADLVFHLTSASAVAPEHVPMPTSAPPLEVIDLRKVWKSPRGLFTIRVRRSDGSVRSASSSAPPSDDEVELVPPSAEQHRHIGRRFLEANVPEERRQPFAVQLDTNERAWWLGWEQLFRSTGPNVRQDWLRFREAELMALLDAALRDSGLTEEIRRKAREAIDRTRTRARHDDLRPDDGLRQALVATLQQMSDEDLRRVWVPAGLLRDALLRKT